MLTTSATESSLDITTLMAEFDRSSSENRKINKATKEIHHQSRFSALDKNITALKEQQKQVNKAGTLSFIFGMISNALNIITSVISTIFPAIAPIATMANKLAQGLIDTISKKFISDANSKASKSATQSELMKKEAENASHYLNIDNDRLSELAENKKSIREHLSQALNLQQESQSTAVQA